MTAAGSTRPSRPRAGPGPNPFPKQRELAFLQRLRAGLYRSRDGRKSFAWAHRAATRDCSRKMLQDFNCSTLDRLNISTQYRGQLSPSTIFDGAYPNCARERGGPGCRHSSAASPGRRIAPRHSPPGDPPGRRAGRLSQYHARGYAHSLSGRLAQAQHPPGYRRGPAFPQGCARDLPRAAHARDRGRTGCPRSQPGVASRHSLRSRPV